jgi:hypothetical protein
MGCSLELRTIRFLAGVDSLCLRIFAVTGANFNEDLQADVEKCWSIAGEFHRQLRRYYHHRLAVASAILLKTVII